MLHIATPIKGVAPPTSGLFHFDFGNQKIRTLMQNRAITKEYNIYS